MGMDDEVKRNKDFGTPSMVDRKGLRYYVMNEKEEEKKTEEVENKTEEEGKKVDDTLAFNATKNLTYGLDLDVGIPRVSDISNATMDAEVKKNKDFGTPSMVDRKGLGYYIM